MPLAVRQFQPTPNPCALKCILDGVVSDRPRSYFNAAQAAGDPLASRLFEIDGVTNLLISGDWITVSKTPEAAWSQIKPAVQQVLREAR